MNKRNLHLLVGLLVLTAACSFDTGATGDECPDDAACAAVPVIPDVEHMELREAFDKLVDADLNVEFSSDLVDQGYEDYVYDRSRGIHPEPWVGDLDPEPGTAMIDDDTVTITAIECPNRAPSCD